MALVGRFNDPSRSPGGTAGHTLGKARKAPGLDPRLRVMGFVGRQAVKVPECFIDGSCGSFRRWREKTEGKIFSRQNGEPSAKVPCFGGLPQP